MRRFYGLLEGLVKLSAFAFMGLLCGERVLQEGGGVGRGGVGWGVVGWGGVGWGGVGGGGGVLNPL